MTTLHAPACDAGATDAHDRLAELNRINFKDLVDNFGIGDSPRLHPVVRRLFGRRVEQFSRMVMEFDRQVGEDGLQQASRALMSGYTRGVRVSGVDNIPADGAVLIAANHAGMTESLACFSVIPRSDLKVVGNDRPFVRNLPHVFERMIAVPEHEGARFSVVRQITRHLQAGHALFINPAGKIEPDPACMPGAVESLQTWSPSLGLFVKRVPAVQVVPALVSGVILPATLSHPLARLRRTPGDRARTAAALQLLAHMRLRERTPVTPQVTFGPPLSGVDLAQLEDPQAITGQITAAMARMMPGAA